MITITADQLHRALTLTQEVAKGADKITPALRCIQCEPTTEGLITRATDRYQVIHTRAPYKDAPAPTPTFLLGTDDVKQLLPVLKREKKAAISIEVTDEKVSVVFPVGRLEYRNQDVDFPDVKKLPVGPVVGVNVDDALGVAPGLLGTLAKLKTFDKSGALMFTAEDAQKPLRWVFSDWAVGALMPVRLTSESGTEERRRMADWLTAAPLAVREEVAA